MGRMQIVISDKLEEEFRLELSRALGFKKGNISIAVEESIRNWIDSNKIKRSQAARKAWETRKKGK